MTTWVKALDRYFTLDNATIDVGGSGSVLDLHLRGGSLGGDYYFSLAAPAGGQMSPGLYDSAERTPFRTAGHPGIDIYGSGGCNETAGRFQVFDYGYTLGQWHAWIDYEQFCEGYQPPLFGEIRINEPLPTPDLRLTQVQAWWPDSAVGATSTAVPITILNTAVRPVSFGSAATTGDAADFDVAADTCSGTVVAPGHECSLQLTFNPTVVGPRAAQLSIPNTDNGVLSIPLSGNGTGTPSGTPPPDPVTQLTAVGAANGTTLHWTNPSTASHVIVRALADPGVSDNAAIGQLLDATTGNTTKVHGLQEATGYTASVFALDDNGNSSTPTTVHFTCCTAPSAPDRYPNHSRRQSSDSQLDSACRQCSRSSDGLHRDPVPQQRHANPDPRRTNAIECHRRRSDQRPAVHVHRHRSKRGRNRITVTTIEPRHPSHRSDSTDHRERSHWKPTSDSVLDSTGLRRRCADHRLRGRPLHRSRSAESSHLPVHRDNTNHHTTDAEHHLPVQVGSHQHGRCRRGITTEQPDHDTQRARRPRDRHRRCRQRTGNNLVERTPLRRRIAHRRLRGHRLRRLQPGRREDLQLDRNHPSHRPAARHNVPIPRAGLQRRRHR